MTPEERFVFDLQGYLVIKGVLSPAEVAELNAVADQQFAPKPGEDTNNRRYFGIVNWGEPYKQLIDHPKIVPYLVELLGPKFRLDHDYSIFMTRGEKLGKLHGGHWTAPDHWYRYQDGVMRNGLSVVTFFISDAAEGDGGFACIPGSHHSNCLGDLPEDVRAFQSPRPYVVQPAVEAGDALFFTEALIHGTTAWTASHERRALLYKYSPGHSAWWQTYYDVDSLRPLTEQQERILSPPSVGGRPDVVAVD